MKTLFRNYLIVFLSASIFTAKAYSQELSPNMFLNKITHRLIGSWPQPADYEALQKELKSKNCANVSCAEGFFRSYIKQKMEKPEFYALFYAEVTEHFGYKTPSSSRLSGIIEQGKARQL